MAGRPDLRESSEVVCRVLLVEDHAIVAEMMRDMLDMIGCKAVLADGVASAKAVEPDRYDVVLCDYRLSDGEATDLVDDLRQRSEAPLVLLSGYAGGDLPETVRSQFDACLSKPVDMSELERELRRLCPPSHPSPHSADDHG